MLESQSQKVTEQNNFSSNQDRQARLIGDLLERILTFLDSPLVVTVFKRLGLLAEGGWLPGMGDARTIAGLTNRPEKSIHNIIGSNPRPKHYIGRQVFFDLSRFAAFSSDPPIDAPAMRNLDE